MNIQQYFGFSDRVFKAIQLDAKMNLPKHLVNGSFGESDFQSVIPVTYINRMSCLIALATIKYGNDQEYLKSVLQALFTKLGNHPSDAIKKDAGRAMCEIHRIVDDCIKRCL